MNIRQISDKRLNTIIATLQDAHLALAASHNLTATDRPDLPREEWPTYVLDHINEIRSIRKLLDLLHVVVSTDSDHEFDFDNKFL